MFLSTLLATAVDYAWGMPLVVLLLGAGFYLASLSKLKVLLSGWHAIKLVAGKFHHQTDKEAKGQLSHFKALTNALSSTVGMGNIAGVAVALNQGGPGAIFWMWVAALLGMNTKFFECTLSIMFRGTDYQGQIQGGPMYVITSALPKLKPLATMFAFCGFFGTLAVYNANQLSAFTVKNYGVDNLLFGIVIAIIVGYVLTGGVKRLADFTGKIVPTMCMLYILAGLGVIILNIDRVGEVFALILEHAFSKNALWGGATGSGIAHVLKIGMKRAAFSNEAGIGTAPMAHSNAHTAEPIAEGLVAMLGPALDTLIVCTITALVILLSLPAEQIMANEGVLLTQLAFEQTYQSYGTHILALVIFLFSFSTLIGTANYNKKCWDFLFQGRFKCDDRVYIPVYCLTIVLGSISAPGDMVNFIDLAFALMSIPNIIATVILAPKVMSAFKIYKEKYL
jgi:AGCS family alanine or glycine:cation symporter